MVTHFHVESFGGIRVAETSENKALMNKAELNKTAVCGTVLCWTIKINES